MSWTGLLLKLVLALTVYDLIFIASAQSVFVAARGLQSLAFLGSYLVSTTYKPLDGLVIFLPPLFLNVLRDKLEKRMPTHIGDIV